jgi:Glycosyl hydrolase family 26
MVGQVRRRLPGPPPECTPPLQRGPRSHPLPTVTLPTTTVPASMSTTTMSTTIAPSTSTTQTVSPPSTSTSASDGPNRSGLAWSSGAYGDDEAGFAVWRGRPLDNTTIWPNRSSWQEISHPDIYRAVSATPKEIDLTLGLAMLPDPANGASFAQCASGAYDQYYRTYGSELVRLGRADSVIRLGWEANGDWYSWSIRSDVANYKACFRRQVAAIRSTDPRARIDWNMNKDSHMDVSVVQAYPGDDVVDIVGVDFYDMWPAYAGLAAWTADYMSTQKGGPRGLGAWLAFAKQHGKLLSVPEWGTTPAADGGGEHPVYIQAMHDFFAAHADDLAYETYFNRHPGFQLWPSTLYPRSAAEYRARY